MQTSIPIPIPHLRSNHDIDVRVASMPGWELFHAQPREYREHVLFSRLRWRLAVEAGASLGGCEWVGRSGDVIAIEQFGASTPGEVLMDAFGFNVDNLVARACALCGHD